MFLLNCSMLDFSPCVNFGTAKAKGRLILFYPQNDFVYFQSHDKNLYWHRQVASLFRHLKRASALTLLLLNKHFLVNISKCLVFP